MNRKVSITYNVEELFSLAGDQPTPTTHHFLATRTAVEHLHGLMVLLSFIGHTETFQTIEDRNLDALTGALRLVGELGAAIGEQCGVRFNDFAQAMKNRVHEVATESMFAEREQAKRRAEFKKEGASDETSRG
jgi:hypothetical protein